MKLSIPHILVCLTMTLSLAAGCGPKGTPVVENQPKETPAEITKEPETSTPKKTNPAPPAPKPPNPTLEAPITDPPPAEAKNKVVQESDTASESEVVDHTDPTSYPITELAAKAEGQLAMLSWNVESGGAKGEVVAEELKALNAGDRYDVVTLTEVLPADLKVYRTALGNHYKYAYSKSGWEDRLQILYNENKFDKIRHFELEEINIKNRYRAPLVVHLTEKSTDTQFLVMVNHLARGKAEIRQEQATKLVEWARNETLPIVGLGDYNFDYVFATEKGNPAFNNFMRDNIYRWVKPTTYIDTNWYDNPREPDGKDDYPGSMLDFAFVAGPSKDWKSTCTIIVREGDFPDGEERSDHRPFEVVFEK